MFRSALRLSVPLAILFATPLAAQDATSQPLPDMNLPSWITAVNLTTVSDDRDADGNGTVVATLTARISPPQVPGLSFDVPIRGTFTNSTGWDLPGADAAEIRMGDFTVRDPGLARGTDGTWSMTGWAVPTGFTAPQTAFLALPDSIELSVTRTSVTATFDAPVDVDLGAGYGLHIPGLVLVDGDGEGAVADLVVDAAVKAATSLIPTGVTIAPDRIRFRPSGSSSSFAVGTVATATLDSLVAEFPAGGTPSVSAFGPLTPKPSSNAARVFTGPVGVQIAIATTGVVATFDLSDSPVDLALGSSPGLRVGSSTLTVPASGSTTWTSAVSGIGAGLSGMSATMSLVGESLQLTDIQGAGPVDGFTVTLAEASNSGSAGAVWTATFDGTLHASDVADLVGLSTTPSSDSQVSGALTSEAVAMTFDQLPPLPFTIPSWMPVGSNSIQDVTVVHRLGDDASTILQFTMNLSFGGVPGFPANAAPLSVTGLWGNGLRPTPPSGGSPAASGSWIAGALAASDPSLALDWLSSATAGSGAAGLILGPKASTDGSASYDVGLGTVDVTRYEGGYDGSNWTFGGHVDFTPSSTPSIPGVTFDAKLAMDFTWDGTTFHASDRFVHTLNEVPGVAMATSTIELQRSVGDTAWTFEIPTTMSWTVGSTRIFSATGKIELGGTPTYVTTAATSFDLPGGYQVGLSDVSIPLVSPISGTASANLPLSSTSKLGEILSGLTALDFGVGFSPSGVDFTATTAPPPIPFGQADTLTFTTLKIQKAGTGLEIGGDVRMAFGAKAFTGDFDVNATRVHVGMQNVPLVEHLTGLDIDLTIAKANGVSEYSGSASGSIAASDFAAFYQAHGLTPPANASGNATVGGSFAPGDVTVTFTDVPLPTIPGGNGIDFTKLEELTVDIDSGAGTQTLGLIADMSIGTSITGLKVTLGVTKAAGATDPDFSLSVSTDTPPTVDVGVGSLAFTSLTGSRTNDVWSVGGDMVLHLSSAVTALRMGSFSFPASIDFDLTVENGGFDATATIDPETVSTGLPGTSMALNGFRLQSFPDSSGMVFGALSALTLPGVPNGIDGLMGFSASGLDFAATVPIPGFTLNLCDPGVTVHGHTAPCTVLPSDDTSTSTTSRRGGSRAASSSTTSTASNGTIASVAVSGIGVTVSTGAGLSVSGTAALTIPDNAAGQKSVLEQITGSSTLSGRITAGATGFQITIGDLGVQQSLDLGKLDPNAWVRVDSLVFGSLGTVAGTGKIHVSGQTLDLSTGIVDGGTYIEAELEANNPLTAAVGNFRFSIGSKLKMATNLLGFATLEVFGVDVSVVDQAGNTTASVSADDATYYLPPAGPIGFLFWDDFGGSIDVAGLETRVSTSLPDPITNANAMTLLQAIFEALSGESASGTLSGLTAPSFTMSAIEAVIPSDMRHAMETIFGDQVDQSSSETTFKITDRVDLELGKFLSTIQVPTPKEMALQLFADVSGTHSVTLGGFTATSTVGFASSEGFHAELKLDEIVGPSSHDHGRMHVVADFATDIGTDGTWDFSTSTGESSTSLPGSSHYHSAHGSGGLSMSLGSDGVSFDAEFVGVSGKVDFSSTEFGFTGHMDTRGSGSNGVVGTLTLKSGSGSGVDGTLYVSGRGYGGSLEIDDGDLKATMSFSESGTKGSLTATVGFGSNPDLGFGGSFEHTYNGTKYEIHGSLELSGHELYISLHPPSSYVGVVNQICVRINLESLSVGYKGFATTGNSCKDASYEEEDAW